MTGNDFKLCPMCGSKGIQNHNNRKWFCPDCGLDLYNNVAAAVGVIIADSHNNILFEVRAKEPRRGFVALPGGFVDPDESAEDAIVRECREELGAEIKNVKFLCTNPNNYEYKGIAYKTCDMFFTAEPSEGLSTIHELLNSLKAQESEVQAFVSYQVSSMDDIEKIPLAFESARKTLQRWVSCSQK